MPQSEDPASGRKSVGDSKVYGLGSGARGLGFRGLGFRGLGFKGLGFRVWGCDIAAIMIGVGLGDTVARLHSDWGIVTIYTSLFKGYSSS